MQKSTKPYDRQVVGVVSLDPAMTIGSEGIYVQGYKVKNKKRISAPLAVSGKKRIKVTDENGPIKAGDLLVTSSESGKAMRCDANQYIEKCAGAVLGKAMSDEVDGKALALITLQ